MVFIEFTQFTQFFIRFCSNVINALLKKCRRVKVKRLFVSLAEKLQLPVVKGLKLSQIDFGASSVYIITKKGESIILKNPVNNNG